MSMWDHIPVEELILSRFHGGIAASPWRAQLEEIRRLPEPGPDDEERKAA
jgi:hypothetical protein